MKIFLSADMEGTCGIVSWPETERSTPFDYTPAQKQMTREVAAACRGALGRCGGFFSQNDTEKFVFIIVHFSIRVNFRSCVFG